MATMRNPYTPVKAEVFMTEPEAKEFFDALPAKYGERLKARELASFNNPEKKYQQLHLFACAAMNEVILPSRWQYSVVYRVE